jgi:hypothetical protein
MTDIESFSRDLEALRGRVAALQEPSKQQMTELTDMASLACVIMFDFERDDAERVALAATTDTDLRVGLAAG